MKLEYNQESNAMLNAILKWKINTKIKQATKKFGRVTDTSHVIRAKFPAKN